MSLHDQVAPLADGKRLVFPVFPSGSARRHDADPRSEREDARRSSDR